MPIDPLSATTFAATTRWMWDSYGKLFVEELAKKLTGIREARNLRHQWEQATTTYLQKLYDEVNNLRVLGKMESQPLEQIYTDVNMLDKLSAERRYRLDELEAEFIPRRRWLREESQRQDGLIVAAQEQRLFILGKPGAGKTTFLKHVALRTIKASTREDSDKKLPIFIILKELSDSGQTIVSYIADQFRQANFPDRENFLRQATNPSTIEDLHKADLPDAENFVHRLLRAGDAIVLFDGLDEVNLEGRQRSNLITAIKQFVHEFDQCRILLTCRVAATDYSFERFAYVEMADFSPEQQKTFIFRWFQQDMVKRDNCWKALQESRNETLRELAQIPLLLSLLCVTFEERNEFPAERSEIYREATQALLGKWDARRNIQRDPIYQSLSLRWKEGLLANIAAQTFANEEYFIPQRRMVKLIEDYLQGVPSIGEPDGDYVLKAMEAQHGLLVERAKNIYSFSHLTLQEYFTAHYIANNEVLGSLPRLMAYVGDDRWREVFLLTSAMLNDATNFAALYLKALANLVAQDDTVMMLLQWGTAKSVRLPSGVEPETARAFNLFSVLTLNLALDRASAFAFTQGLNLDLGLIRDLASALDLNPNRDHRLILALDLAFDLVRVLNLDPDFNLALTFDRDHARNLARTLTLDRNLTHTLADVLELDLTRDRDLARALTRVLARVRVRTLALDLAVTYDLDFVNQIPNETAKIVAALQIWSDRFDLPVQSRLAMLHVPNNEAEFIKWKAFDAELEQILLHHWGLEKFWELSEEQTSLLIQYLQANRLLLESLERGYLPHREAILDQLLLPPGWGQQIEQSQAVSGTG